MENPWIKMPSKPPYVLSEDLNIIKEINSRLSKHKVETTLLPEPFIGDLEAPIYLLTKAPGVDENDIIWHRKELFKDLLWNNYYQKLGDPKFLYLDPKISEAPGYKKWKHYLKDLIEDTSENVVANKICSIPYFPYHKNEFNRVLHNQKQTFPSLTYTKFLINQAIKRSAMIIIMSGKRYWLDFIPELSKYPKTGILKSQQNLRISINNFRNSYIYDELIAVLSSY